MKKLFISLFFLAFTNTNGISLGEWLSTLTINDIRYNKDLSPLVPIKYRDSSYYQVNTLQQLKNESTCGRNTMFNLFHFINALSADKPSLIKARLRPLFNRYIFNMFNILVCDNLKIINEWEEQTNDLQINKIVKEIQDRTLQNRDKLIKIFLPKNADKIAYTITPAIWFYNMNVFKMINKCEFITYKDIIKILNGIYGVEELIRLISIFKAAKDKKILGIPLALPLFNGDAVKIHYIAITCRKIKSDKFEFFVLDSSNSKKESWFCMLEFLKHLINLPTDRLQEIAKNLRG